MVTVMQITYYVINWPYFHIDIYENMHLNKNMHEKFRFTKITIPKGFRTYWLNFFITETGFFTLCYITN